MPKFTYSKFFKTELLCLLLFVGMAAAQSNDDNHNNPLYVDPATQDFSENPKLLDRILAGPRPRSVIAYCSIWASPWRLNDGVPGNASLKLLQTTLIN